MKKNISFQIIKYVCPKCDYRVVKETDIPQTKRPKCPACGRLMIDESTIENK